MPTRFAAAITVATLGLCGIAASQAHADDTPPVPGAVPALSRTEVIPGPTTTNQSSSITVQQFNQLVHTREKQTHHKVVFYWKKDGLGNVSGCLSPVKMKWIKPNGLFRNTWLGNDIGWRHWRASDLLCNISRGHDANGDYITGTIKRCGNEHVKIYLHWPKHKVRKVLKVEEFVSKEEFIRRFATNITNSTNTNTSTTTNVTYYCADSSFTLSGKWCLPPVGPPPPPPPPPVPAPLVDVTGAPAHFYVNGNGYVFAKVQAAPGHNATLDFEVSDGNVNGKVQSDMYDKTPCPSGWVCYRAHYWAPSYPVTSVYLLAIATQDDGQFGTGDASFEIKPDEGF